MDIRPVQILPVGEGVVQDRRFLSAGGGARGRSLLDKLRDIVSVNDFGAVADGNTDDTTAINKAIPTVALSGGGEVVFGHSDESYRVAGPVLLPSNIILNFERSDASGGGKHRHDVRNGDRQGRPSRIEPRRSGQHDRRLLYFGSERTN